MNYPRSTCILVTILNYCLNSLTSRFCFLQSCKEFCFCLCYGSLTVSQRVTVYLQLHLHHFCLNFIITLIIDIFLPRDENLNQWTVSFLNLFLIFLLQVYIEAQIYLILTTHMQPLYLFLTLHKKSISPNHMHYT